MSTPRTQHSVGRIVELAAIAPVWLTVLLVPLIRSWPPETSAPWLVLIAVATFAVMGAAAKRPLHGLVALILMIGLLGYFRVATPAGKDLLRVLSAAVGVGASVALVVRSPGRLAEAAGRLLPWVVGHSIVLGLWAGLALIRYSTRLQPLLAALQLEELSWLGGSSVNPANSAPVYAALAGAQGPALALLVIAAIWRPQTSCFSRRRAGAFVVALLTTALVNLGVGFGQSFIPSFPIVPLRTVILGTEAAATAGLFHNSNLFAQLIVLVTPLSLTLLGDSRSDRRLRILAAGIVGLIVLVLPGVNSRTSTAGVALTVIVVVALFARRAVPLPRFAYLAVGALALSVGISMFTDSSWVPFMRGMVTQTAPGVAGGDVDVGMQALLGVDADRTDTNRLALLMLRDHPLVGVGLGGNAALLPAYYELHGVVSAQRSVHLTSFPLRTLVELGVVGSAVRLGLFGILFGPVFVAGWATWAGRRPMDLDVGLGVGCATLLLGSVWSGQWVANTQISLVFLTALALVRVWPRLGPVPPSRESD